MKQQNITGGCLCGAIRYESTARPDKSGYCHCRNCQKVSGAPVTVGVFFALSSFRYTRGAPKYFQTSEKVERGFCERCGSRLTYRIFDSDQIAVEVGSLDHPEAAPPTYHIGVESQLSWFDTRDEHPRRRIDTR